MTTAAVTTNQIAAIRAALRANPHANDPGWWIWPVTILAPGLLMLGIAFQPWVSPADLLRDPLAVAEMSDNCCKVYFGAVSNAGVLLWASTTAICLFSAAILYGLSRPIAEILFMLFAGLLTGVLTLDDLYLVHENVLPALGVPQPVTYAGYGLCGLIYLTVSWREILDYRYGLLAVAIVLLSISVTIDWLIHSENVIRILLEDGAKLCGIFAWTSFHVTAAWQCLTTKRGLAR